MWQGFLIKYGIYLLIGLGLVAVGAGGMWKYKNNEVKEIQTRLTVAEEANKADQITIARLNDDIQKASKTCAVRIDAKDKLIKEFQRILNLRGINEGGNGTDIINELNILWQVGGGKDGVRPKNSPAPPG
jgi:hypothetical protein